MAEQALSKRGTVQPLMQCSLEEYEIDVFSVTKAHGSQKSSSDGNLHILFG